MDRKKVSVLVSLVLLFFTCTAANCENSSANNTTAKDEQARTEINQRNLFTKQPPPNVAWSLERDNLIKRFKLQNDRSVLFYMYVFNYGIAEPVGYYQVNKVSSVDSQLTNPAQLVRGDGGQYDGDFVLPSPAEDGSYGTNGSGVFGFTPEDVYLEHNMQYIVSTIPLNFPNARRIALVNAETAEQVKQMMERIKK
jgi:hypothetical protein